MTLVQTILETSKTINLSWLKKPSSDQECHALTEALETLLEENPQSELIDILVDLIKKYEETAYPIPKARPVEVLRFLMEQHHLKQVDLIDIFANQGNVSQVLNGKRGMSLENIKGLSQRFNVSVAVFIEV